MTRRALLAAALGGVAATCAGCGVTLQRGAPAIPLLPTPTRQPVADEDLLRGAWRDTQRLGDAAASVTGPQRQLCRRLAAVHRAQHRALDRMLRRAGVPLPPAPGATAASAGPSGGGPSPTPPATRSRVSADALAAREAAAVGSAALDRLGRSTSSGLPTLAAVAAQRAAAATLLGAAPRWSGASRLPPDAAATVLKATRPAVYAFQVVTARAEHGLRRRASRTLVALQVQERSLEAWAGSAAPAPPLGYELPGPARSPEQLRALAQAGLAPLLPATAALLAAAAGQRTEVATLVRLLAQQATWATQWGVSLAPFPGLTAPGLTS
ncbi:MAG TPA: DUF4439 domain-containing protein [Segeticoccus sp.]|uniref:DUF4439 domain-containing protein n=1 Tax=Segeticoccus sp. TaxID=2706531 RepID=UPI002D7ED03E|nr:DUF4439 domain-containing protein [Segeticoccus sp.]HET8598831.1 DUF4439 domain-containing protein [Segeticoccus sp.]